MAPLRSSKIGFLHHSSRGQLRVLDSIEPRRLGLVSKQYIVCLVHHNSNSLRSKLALQHSHNLLGHHHNCRVRQLVLRNRR
jgi:hypothetical protein